MIDYCDCRVLQNISDSIVAIYTTQGMNVATWIINTRVNSAYKLTSNFILNYSGAHCLDILPALPNDPDWLVSQRNMEKKIMEGWIADYNANFSRAAVNKPKNGI